MGNKLSGKDLIKLGFPKNNSINIALGQINRYRKREKKESFKWTNNIISQHTDEFYLEEKLKKPFIKEKEIFSNWIIISSSSYVNDKFLKNTKYTSSRFNTYNYWNK